MSEKGNSGKKWAGCPIISIGVFFALLLFYVLYALNVNKNANIWVGVILYLSSLFISFVVWYYGTTLVCSANNLQDLSKIKPQCIILVTLELIALVLLFPKYFILFTVIFVICFICIFNYRGGKIIKVITDEICFIAKHILETISKSLLKLLLVGAILVLCVLIIYELISKICMMLSKISGFILLILAILAILAIVFLASTKFFYTEYECWRKRVWTNIEEWFLTLDNSFDKFLSWLAFFLILLVLIFAGAVILCSNSSNKSWCKFLVNLITNRDLFEWTFNLFLFTFFALIISVLGQLFSGNSNKTKSPDDSEFLFYMLSVRALIIWSIVLIVAYALTRTFILSTMQHLSALYVYKNHLIPCCIDKYMACVNSVGNSNMLIISIFWISIYYAIFITIYYYFSEKFFEVINFTMPAHRLQMKIKVLSRSPLNKNTLRLWNALWRNEEFDNLWEEAAFLSSFIRKIVYYKIKNYKDIFQLEDKVSVAADALRGFSENIDKRYPEAIAIEILDIVPRRDAQPGLLLDYLTDVLNAYKDIVCNDKLVCEEPDFEISFYKWFFKSAANEFLPKYQYLDKLIYQILVTLRKSVGKLRNDGYFDYYDDRGKTLCEKFNEFVEEISHLECGNNESEERLEKALKTESAKKWIKEAGNLLEEVGNKINYYNIYYNIVCHDCSTLRSDFTKALQALKKGKIDTDTIEKILEEWKKICKQDNAK